MEEIVNTNVKENKEEEQGIQPNSEDERNQTIIAYGE